MDRAVPVATGFLVGVCVFAWLAGPVLEARFGAEALVAAYGAVAVGTAVTTYVVVRRLDARLGGSTAKEANRGSETDGDVRGGRRADDESGGGRRAGDNDDRGEPATVTVSLDELEELDVDREVRQLKAERSDGDGD
ncbi:hypothetical protein [Halorubrum tibetense]|uniref:Uncharacterized protein n=1 Tax=Halorubrum tibetense TaxID=175631 RepID=A0ABD5S9L9_9EURY